ncbi:hypothetical protein BOX15_Mlig001054g1 [Macrostomum lignano]|uniref:LRAT domain-containing protein n=1 Tax=Macrostomum lignano TaxID=282301 RepID=A0A267ELC5_9PLAT|nr:hypothetical protein BOX15_Mlig001054g1 [Macrostomum lignano]
MVDKGSRTENEAAENLFTGCHIEFLRLVPLTSVRLYSHHAYLHELKILQDGLAEGAMYEKGTLHPKVCEKTVDLSNATIKLVKYSGFKKLTRELGETRLKQVEGRTFLDVRDRTKAGSKVRDSDFCFWFMTGADLEYLFGRRLKQLQKNVNELAKLKVLYEHSDTFARIESATLEELRDGGSQPLEPFSHLIVETKETRCRCSEKTQVRHYVFKNWNENSRDKMEAVTYTVTKDASCLQTEVQEVKSIVRVTGPNQVVKVVDDEHPESMTIKNNFEALDEDKKYNLLCDNCEHFVNQLKYGEKSSKQVECCLPGSKMRIFGGAIWTLFRSASYFASSFPFASYWPEVGFGIFVAADLSALLKALEIGLKRRTPTARR